MEAIYKEINNLKDVMHVEFSKVFSKIENSLNELSLEEIKKAISDYTGSRVYDKYVQRSFSQNSSFSKGADVYEVTYLEGGSDGEMVDELLFGIYDREEYIGELKDGENKYQFCVFHGDPRADYFFGEIETAYKHITLGSLQSVLEKLYKFENSLTKK